VGCQIGSLTDSDLFKDSSFESFHKVLEYQAMKRYQIHVLFNLVLFGFDEGTMRFLSVRVIEFFTGGGDT
jgi:hypothetical protein